MTQLDPTTIAARGRACAGRGAVRPVHVVRDRRRRRPGDGDRRTRSSPTSPASRGSRPRPACRSRASPSCIFFLIIVVAMYARGARCRSAGHARPRRGLPAAPRARPACSTPALVLGAVAVVALLVFPFDFRQALINSLIGMVVCLSLVVTTGFVGQISIVQVGARRRLRVRGLQACGPCRDRLPARPARRRLAATAVGSVVAAVSALRVRGVSLAIVTLAAGGGMEEFVFANPTIGGGESGAPVPSPAPARHRPRSEGGVPDQRGDAPEPGVRLRLRDRCCAAGNARRRAPAQRARPADARGALQRARGGRRRHRRARDQADRRSRSPRSSPGSRARCTPTTSDRSRPGGSASSRHSASSRSPISAGSRPSRARSSAACSSPRGS